MEDVKHLSTAGTPRYTRFMRTAQVSELKERLDEVIEAVKNGETVEIREGKAEVAKLVPSFPDFPLSDATPESREPRSRKRADAAPVRSSHSSKEDALDNPAEQSWERFFLNNLSLIDRVIGFVCGKYGLSGADADDFASLAKLKLTENDYAVLRNFEHKGSLLKYLTIVISRSYLDQKIHEWGKWRPSMRVQQGGDAAVYLERLVSRDGLDVEEASTIVRKKYTELDSRALERLAASIVVRQPRRSANVERTEEMREPASEASAEDALPNREREVAARRASAVLSRELDRLPPEDRLIMKLRFIDAMKVSTMAKMLEADQKQLYRRIDRLVTALREALLAAGVGMSDIGDMLIHGTGTLQIADQIALKGHIDELVRQGKARRGTGTLPADFLTRALPAAKKSVLEALLEDRHSD